MAAPSYVDLKGKVKEFQVAESALKAEIERLTGELAGKAEGSDEAKRDAEAKAKAEAETAELQKQIEDLTAQISTMSGSDEAKVILSRPYAFYDDEDVLHQWQAGEVTDEDHINTLRDRGVI
jgi:septal ring factor EnvC (AmiA/AmiB activator)